MTSLKTTPQAFPSSGRRLVVYVMYNRRGDVEDYVLHALRGLRVHATRLLVVVNGGLTVDARSRISGIADDVIRRENIGVDVGAYQAALLASDEELGSYDELLLTNDSWYGPLTSFSELFARMDSQPLDFWGMTAHAPAKPHPLTSTGCAPYHLQSHWIAVRRPMLQADGWHAFWRDLPHIRGYRDAVLKFETRFTHHFRMLGFIGAAAYDIDRYPTDNASLWSPERLIEDGCPIVKRRVLFHSPVELDSHAVVGRWVPSRILESGFPAHALWRDLSRNVQPKVLNATAGLLDVLSSEDAGLYDPAQPLRTLVAAHIFYAEMTEEILDRVDALPSGFDLVVTTTTETKAEAIRAVIAGRRLRGTSEVRIVESNDGRDQSAFLVAVRPELLSGQYDLVVKVHSKRTPQDSFNIGRHFSQQQFDNLLQTSGYASNVVGLFQRQPELGIVYPPAIHIGYPTLGHGWWANRPGFARLCDLLGIRVPLDDSSPLAPYGSMFIARPDALRILIDHKWRYEDFGGAAQYHDGGLAHILERMPSYAAGERGYLTRTILNSDYAAVSQTALEFDFDQLTALFPVTADEQLAALHRAGHFGTGRGRDFARVYVRSRWPGAGARLRRILGPIVSLPRRLRRSPGAGQWERDG